MIKIPPTSSAQDRGTRLQNSCLALQRRPTNAATVIPFSDTPSFDYDFSILEKKDHVRHLR